MLNVFKIIKADFKLIPDSVKLIVLIISFWYFAWGVIDPLWSIYLKSVVNNYALV